MMADKAEAAEKRGSGEGDKGAAAAAPSRKRRKTEAKTEGAEAAAAAPSEEATATKAGPWEARPGPGVVDLPPDALRIVLLRCGLTTQEVVRACCACRTFRDAAGPGGIAVPLIGKGSSLYWRRRAMRALGLIGAAAPAWVADAVAEHLGESDDALRAEVVGALGKMAAGQHAGAVAEELGKGWSDGKARVAAIAALGQMGAVAAPVVVARLGDQRAAVRVDAVKALGLIGVAAPAAAVEALAEHLRGISARASETQSTVFEAAGVAFGRIGAEAAPFLGPFLEGSTAHAFAAAKALSVVADAAMVVPHADALVGLLHGEARPALGVHNLHTGTRPLGRLDVCCEAAAALGNVGSLETLAEETKGKAAEALAALLLEQEEGCAADEGDSPQHEHEGQLLRDAAARALGRFSAKAAAKGTVTAALSARLSHSSAAVRRRAARALAEMGGEAAAEHAPELAKSLGDTDVRTRCEAARALGAMSVAVVAPHAGALATQLRADIKGPEGAPLRLAAVTALGNVAAAVARGEPEVRCDVEVTAHVVLVARLLQRACLKDDPHDVVSGAAQDALVQFGAAAVAPVALRFLDPKRHAGSLARYSAGKVLGDVAVSGPEGNAAVAPLVPDLIECCGTHLAVGGTESGRAGAAAALRGVGPAAVAEAAKLLTDKKKDLRIWGVTTLGYIGHPLNEPYVEAVVVLMGKDKCAAVSVRAATALAGFGRRQVLGQLPVLDALLADPKHHKIHSGIRMALDGLCIRSCRDGVSFGPEQ